MTSWTVSRGCMQGGAGRGEKALVPGASIVVSGGPGGDQSQRPDSGRSAPAMSAGGSMTRGQRHGGALPARPRQLCPRRFAGRRGGLPPESHLHPGGDGGSLPSPCSPRDSQKSSPTPQFKSINSLALSFLHSLTLTSIHDYWKNHSLD